MTLGFVSPEMGSFRRFGCGDWCWKVWFGIAGWGFGKHSDSVLHSTDLEEDSGYEAALGKGG